MMKWLVYVIFVLVIGSIIITSGCTQQVIACDPPYIRIGASCCLDQNENNICDTDEPRCNDGLCNGEETCGTCPQDCGSCDFVCNNTQVTIKHAWYDEETNAINFLIKNERRFPLTIQPFVNNISSRRFGSLFYLRANDVAAIKLEEIELDDFHAVKSIGIKIIECNEIGDTRTRKHINVSISRPGEPIKMCTSHAEEKCSGNYVYWFDSCGNKEEEKEYCDCGCDNGSCIESPSIAMEIDFEPNKEVKWCGVVSNEKNSTIKVSLSDEGELKEFGTFNEEDFYLEPTESKNIVYTLRLPEKLELGRYETRFVISEEIKLEEGPFLGAKWTAVKGGIIVNVS
ncbi:MAG: hypothetical protein ACTSQ8_25770 [Candidatus Helarchaeota archaeon]